MTPLTPHERATLSDADRAMLDAALQAIPSEHDALFTALLLSTRAIVHHDTSGVRTAAEGYAELLDAADERARDLLEAARALQEAAAASDQRLVALEERMAESSADRKAIHRQLYATRRWVSALAVAVIAGLPLIVLIFARIVYVVLWGSA